MLVYQRIWFVGVWHSMTYKVWLISDPCLLGYTGTPSTLGLIKSARNQRSVNGQFIGGDPRHQTYQFRTKWMFWWHNSLGYRYNYWYYIMGYTSMYPTHSPTIPCQEWRVSLEDFPQNTFFLKSLSPRLSRPIPEHRGISPLDSPGSSMIWRLAMLGSVMTWKEHFWKPWRMINHYGLWNYMEL